MRRRGRQAGFVVSAEMMLIALILAIGLITGWVKLRDQSLAEIKDTMAAIDAYLLGSGPLWQIGGTRWIVAGAIVEPTIPAVSELWDNGVDPPFAWPTVVETSAPGSDPRVFKTKDGILVYGAPTAEAP